MEEQRIALGALLRRSANRLTESQAKAMRSHGMTAAEWAVVAHLRSSGPIAPSVLAAQVGLTRGAVTRLVDRLLAKQLVVRVDDRNDRRRHLLALTGAGARRAAEAVDAATGVENAFFSALDSRQRVQLARMLAALARA